jgi:cytochrome c
MRSVVIILAAFVGCALLLAPAPARAQDGQAAFNNHCRQCHSARAGDNRLGPSLYGVVGRKSGSLPNYGFSDSMKSASIVWDKDNLDKFIADPDQVVPGHNMKPFSGITSADERVKIISYLASIGK